MIVINNTAHVIVLKAHGELPLRLFPGHNTVEEKSLEKYMKNNPAAQGFAEKNLKIVNKDGISMDELAEAKRAKEKNDKLNKDASTI